MNSSLSLLASEYASLRHISSLAKEILNIRQQFSPNIPELPSSLILNLVSHPDDYVKFEFFNIYSKETEFFEFSDLPDELQPSIDPETTELIFVENKASNPVISIHKNLFLLSKENLISVLSKSAEDKSKKIKALKLREEISELESKLSTLKLMQN